jgi:hypothetical protein
VKRAAAKSTPKTKASVGQKTPVPAKKVAVAKEPVAKKKVAAPATKSARGKRDPAPATKFGPRADLGAPVDGFFGRQPPHLRAILDELRALVEEIAPDATASLKWGMPFYTIGGNTMCALAGFKAHVNLILPGSPESFVDPDGLLEGDGKTGKHIKLRALAEIPRGAVQIWLRAAADRARKTA